MLVELHNFKKSGIIHYSLGKNGYAQIQLFADVWIFTQNKVI